MDNKNDYDLELPKYSYHMGNAMVLIICISKYRGSIPDLDGSLSDFETLIHLFKNTMGFDVIHNVMIKDDKDSSLYVDTEKFKRYLDQTRLQLTDPKSNYDAFIFAFSGHGYKSGIMTSDGSTHELKDIAKRFSAKNVSLLKDEPKIFIIDACRHRQGKLPFDARYRNRSSTLTQIKGNYNTKKFNFYHPYVNVLQIYGNTIKYGVFDAVNGTNLISLFSKHLTRYVSELENKKTSNDEKSIDEVLLAMKKELHRKTGGLQAMEINNTMMYDLYISKKQKGNKITNQINDEIKDEIKDDEKQLQQDNQDTMSLIQPLVLLLCVSKYDKNSGFKDLSGVEKDMERLKDLFETTCKYRVICNQVKKNVFGQAKGFYLDKNSFERMLEKAKSELQKSNNSNNNDYDGLIVVFSGHGYQDGIITSDGVKHDLRKIKQFFSAKNVPSLKDKTKIFIIDACRHEYEKLPDKDDDGQDSRYQVKGKINKKRKTSMVEYKWYHPFVNVLEIYGNTPGYSVTATKTDGSLMILSLSKCIKQYFTNNQKSNNNDNQQTIRQILIPMKYEIHRMSDGKQVIEINDTLLYNLRMLNKEKNKFEISKWIFQKFGSYNQDDNLLRVCFVTQ